MIDCLRSFCLVKSKVAAHQVALGPISMMLRCVTVKTVASIDLVGMPQNRLLWRDKTCPART